MGLIEQYVPKPSGNYWETVPHWLGQWSSSEASASNVNLKPSLHPLNGVLIFSTWRLALRASLLS